MRESVFESMRHFAKILCLDITPEETKVYRCLIIRLLYFIKEINIEGCIKKIEKYGIHIGKYNVFDTETHLTYKMQSMDVFDWVDFINCISITSIDHIFTDLSTEYNSDLETSPLWNLKRVFEENNIINESNPYLIIHTFLVLHNREVNKDQILYTLLQNNRDKNVNDVILRILGITNLKTYQKHIEMDLCIIIKYMQFNCMEEMKTHFQNDSIQVDTRMSKKTYRPSLLTMQKLVLSRRERSDKTLHKNAQTVAIYYPNDININMDKWNCLSYAQRRIILLFMSIKSESFPDLPAYVTKITKIPMDASILHYKFKPNRIQDVVTSIYPLILRCSDCIDLSKESVIHVLAKFKEQCYNGVFGQTQQSLMNTTFNLQLYIIAYLDTQIQLKCYKLVVDNFNLAMKHCNPELRLIDYLPPILAASFEQWSKNNVFSGGIIDIIIPLSI